MGQQRIQGAPLGLKDRVKGIKLVARMFAHLGPEKDIVRALFLTDESLSLALRRKGELVGVYLVRKNNHETPYDGFTRPNYDGSKGLKVESLAILPSLRGQGYGRLLRAALPAMAKRRGFDFVWGAALTALDNKQDWLRRRVLEDEKEHGFVTVEPLNEAMKKRVAPKATPELLARWNRMKRASNGTLQGRLVLACRLSLGLPRSREGDALSNPSSMSVRRSAQQPLWRYKHCSTTSLCWRRWKHSG
jgi:GNAT superfamily N-acetyltransferase